MEKRRERQPKPFPQYDDAVHLDSAAVAPPPAPQNMALRGDPAATEYTERYCAPEKHG